MFRIIDMHIHTSQSDGTLSPTDIVRLALKVGIKAIAITDHDAVSGIAEAQSAAKGTDLEVIPGIEISVGNSGSLHILGYYIDYQNKILSDLIDDLQIGRQNRNNEMINKLRALGFDISLNAVQTLAGTQNIGRLHIEQYIKSSGQLGDNKQFFKKYLVKGGLAFAPRKTVSEKRGIKAIIAAGGLPFLAHLSYLNMPHQGIEKTVQRLVSYGLCGIECYYSNYTHEDEEFCLYLCDKFKLQKSGGTDFHGSRRKGVYLGTGRGNMCVPYDLLLPIKRAAGIELPSIKK